MCNVCGKNFGSVTNPNYHSKCVHDRVRDSDCKICNKGFSSNNKLKCNVKALREEVRDHQCNVSDKSFKSLTILEFTKRWYLREREIMSVFRVTNAMITILALFIP